MRKIFLLKFDGLLFKVKKGAHLKNFVSMVAIDTMAIGGSDIARDLLRVNVVIILFRINLKVFFFLESLQANGRDERI